MTEKCEIVVRTKDVFVDAIKPSCMTVSASCSVDVRGYTEASTGFSFSGWTTKELVRRGPLTTSS